jgi:hypothetical protein
VSESRRVRVGQRRRAVARSAARGGARSGPCRRSPSAGSMDRPPETKIEAFRVGLKNSASSAGNIGPLIRVIVLSAAAVQHTVLHAHSCGAACSTNGMLPEEHHSAFCSASAACSIQCCLKHTVTPASQTACSTLFYVLQTCNPAGIPGGRLSEFSRLTLSFAMCCIKPDPTYNYHNMHKYYNVYNR